MKKRGEKPKVAFVTNFIEMKDVRLQYFFPMLGRMIPLSLLKLIFRFLPDSRAFKIVSNFDVRQMAQGYIILILLSPEEMLRYRKKAIARIRAAVLYAQNILGVEIVGLGSLTKSFTEGGSLLARDPDIRVKITHGDSLSVGIAMDGIRMIADHYYPRQTPTIAVLGCYGTIGRALSAILAAAHYPLILYGRSRGELEKLRKEIKREGVRITEDIKDCAHADIIVTATSSPYALLRSEHLRKGAVVYEIAQPNNLSEGVLEERPDVVKIQGGFVTVDREIDLKFWMRLPRGITYACTAESVVQALEQGGESHVGEIDLAYVPRIRDLAKKWGFLHAPMF